VPGVPDLHRPGYEYPPYRETVDFKYDVHNGFFQTRVGNDSDLIHYFKSSGQELEDALLECLENSSDSMKIEILKDEGRSMIVGHKLPSLVTRAFVFRLWSFV